MKFANVHNSVILKTFKKTFLLSGYTYILKVEALIQNLEHSSTEAVRSSGACSDLYISRT